MSFERFRPVMYRGELVALAGRYRFHLLAPWLDELPTSNRDVRFVALLCLYHRQVLFGALPDGAAPEVAERWATLVLGNQPEEPPKRKTGTRPGRLGGAGATSAHFTRKGHSGPQCSRHARKPAPRRPRSWLR
jgi:hypothetical protein